MHFGGFCGDNFLACFLNLDSSCLSGGVFVSEPCVLFVAFVVVVVLMCFVQWEGSKVETLFFLWLFHPL